MTKSNMVFPLIISGLSVCYASPTTANVVRLTGPTAPSQGSPFDGNFPAMPEQDHGPHSNEEPGEGLIVTNFGAASGGLTNTSAGMITTAGQIWVLPTFSATYDRDLLFANAFDRTGASLLLQVQAEDANGQRRT